MTIAGDWYSDLGSHMQLSTDASGGITGSYLPAAGHLTGRYLLVGRYDPIAEPEQGTAVGWTVVWRNAHGNAHSVTNWSGQYFDHGEERIRATWLLAMSAPADDTWKSTVVGQDVFTRTLPDPAATDHPGRVLPADPG
jgi:hypothetical protein